MGEVGILGKGARVELIEGEIIDMAPIGSPHAGMVRWLTQWLSRQVTNLAIVSVQNPVVLGTHSEPEPDVALLRPREDFYSTSHPASEDVLLIIEISDTALHYDREVKVPLYARHGIPEVWLIDLENRAVEIYRQPGQGGYGQVLHPESHENIQALLLPYVSLSVGSLWSKG